MAEYISSFITGFQKVVEEDLQKRLSNCKILNVFDGLIHYSYNGNSRDLEKIIYFNNTFFVLKAVKGKNITFPFLINAVTSEKKYFLINKGSFRIRFVRENQFQKVDKTLSRKAEEMVLKNSRLSIDRVSPTTEIWYSIRRENFAFCGQLISKREFTEKNLNKGELRPEFAYLMCAFANLPPDARVADPFCGYGSIPVQLSKKFSVNQLFVSDIDEEKINQLKNNKHLQKENILINQWNAMELSSIHLLQEKPLDFVITDPPWGFYEEIGDIKDFYEKMFDSLKKVLKKEGQIIILSARKEEIESVAEKCSFVITDSIHTLVNGKKAALYKMVLNN